MTFAKGHKPSPLSHWQKGVRRNSDRGDWERTRLAIGNLLDEHPEPNVISFKAIADAADVSDKATARKWIRGVNRPDEATQGVLAEWAKQQAERIRAEKKRSK